MKLIDKILDYINPKTTEYDFEQRCLFPEQLTYKMYNKDNKKFAEVPMQSGRAALYEVITERCDYSADDTGQRHWKFKFVRFIS